MVQPPSGLIPHGLVPLTRVLQAGDRQQMAAHLRSQEEALPGIMPPASSTSSEAVQEQAAALVELLKKGVGQ